MTKTLILLAIAGAAATTANAQWPAPVERALSAEYNHCMDTGEAGNGVTGAMVDCAARETERQDARLNQAYRRTLQRLTPARQLRLRTDERAWIVKRDRGCRREAGTEGTIVAVNLSQCLLRETIARRLWLEKYR